MFNENNTNTSLVDRLVDNAQEAENLVACDCCGAAYDPDLLVCVEGGDLVCASCLDDSYAYCEDCDEYVPTDDLVRVNPDLRDEMYVCSYCADRNYYRCTDCGEYYDLDHIAGENSYGDSVCNYCYTHLDLGRCSDCDIIFPLEDLTTVGRWGECYCEDCRPEPDGLDLINSYSFKPCARIHRHCGEIDALTFGVELEIDNMDTDDEDLKAECARALYDLSDDQDLFYLKSDGSLSDMGIEIVTHPCSLAYHLNSFPWGAIRNAARDHEYTSHDARTCGLHVHIGRQQLGNDDFERRANAAKLVLLVDHLWADMLTFSRRKENQVSRWAHRPYFDRESLVDCTDDDDRIALALRSKDCGRYQAVNLQNSRTVELRLFNGSLNVQTIRATITLASCLAQYALTHEVSECLRCTFGDVVAMQPTDELLAYCESRRMKLNVLASK